MSATLSLKAAALRMLAQREQSVAELRRKLLRRASAAAAEAAEAAEAPGAPGAPGADATALSAADEVERVVAWLIDNRHLSEERFAESRVHARAARFGNLRIRHELAQHGIELGAAAAAELAASEAQRALAVWRRKYTRAPADARERAKQMRFLASRGFSAAVIGELMRRCGSPDEDDA